VRVSARSDYALRAAAELATAGADERLKRETLASRQDIPLEFLESVLLDLKHAGIVQSQRGASGGFRLARPPAEISLADVIRAVDGPIADVRGGRPERIEYRGPAQHLQHVWIAVRASLREILEGTSLKDLVDGNLSPEILRLTDAPDAWVSVGRVRGPTPFKTAAPRRRNAARRA
jgi:Rrf2 family protein